MNCLIPKLIAGLAVLVGSSFVDQTVATAQNISDLQGAWIQYSVPCDQVYVTDNGQSRFRPNQRDLFTSAFIITGDRLSTANASCQIVAISNKELRRELSLSCTTPITTVPIVALLSLETGGTLRRYFDAGDRVGDEYKRCGR